MANNSNHIMNRYGKWITNKQKERLRKLYKGYRQSTAGDMRSQYLNAHKGMYGVRTTASAYGLGEGYVARKKAQMDSSLAEAGRQYAAQADAAFENNAVRPAANATIQAENERKQREYEEKLRKAREKAARQAKAQADYEKALEEYNRNKDKTDKENAKRLAEYKRAMAKYKKELKNAKQRGEKLDRLPQRQVLHGGQPLPKGLSLSADLHQYEGPASSTKPKKGKKNLPLPKKGKNGGRGGLLSTDMYEYESGTGHQPIATSHQGLNNRPVAPKTNYAANQTAVQNRKKAKEAVVGKPTKPILAITDTPIPVAPHIEKDLVAKVEATKPEEIPQLKADYINSAVEHERLVGELYNEMKSDMNRIGLMQEFDHWVGVAQNTTLSPAERKQAAMYASRAAEEYNLQDNGKAHKERVAMLTQMVNDSHDQLTQMQYVLQQKGVRMSEDEIGFDTGYLRQYGAIPAQANDTAYAQAQALGDKNSDLGKQLRQLTKMEYLHSQGLPSGQLSPQMQAFIEENNLGWLIDQEVLDRAPLVGIETAIEEKLKKGGDERTEYLQRKGIDRVQRELSTSNPEAIKRVIESGDSVTHLKDLSQIDTSVANFQSMATGGGHQGKTGNEVIKELEKNLDLPSGYISFNTLEALKKDEASVAFIDYCYATGQEDLAKQYIFDLTEAANKAAGEKQADKISNLLPDGWKWIPEFMYHLGYGASNAIWGKIDFFRGKTPTRTGAYTQEGIIQNEIERGWSEGKARNWANALTSAGENFTDLAIGTLAGNALGAAGDAIGGTVGNIVGKVAGHAPGISMGWSAAGSAKQEMLKKGYNEKAATLYGIFSGVSEAVLQEQVGGLVGFGDRGAFTKALSGLVNQIPNAAGRTAINAVLDVASEIGQEEFGNILDSVYRSVALGEGNDVYADFKEQFNETAVTTAISTLLLNALHIPTQIRNERGYSAIADASGMSLNDAKFLLETDAAINRGERVDPNDILRYNELTANLMASMPDNVVKAINDNKMTVADWVTSNEGVVQGKLTGKLTEADTKTEAAKNPVTGAEIKAVDHTEALKGKTDEQRRDYLLNAAPTGKVGSAYYTTTNGKAIEFKNLDTTQKANYVLAQKCAKAFEGSVDVVIHDTLPLSNGAMVGSDGKLHIALDVTNEQGRESIAYWTLAHEAGHALKIADSKAWGEMFDVLTDYAKNHKDRDGKSLYDALVDSITNQYKYDNDSDAFNDEMFSLIAERMVGSEGEQWAATLGDNTIFDAIAKDRNASAKAKRGFLGKMKNAVEKLSRQFRDGGFSKERKRLAKIREQLTEAYKRINEAPSIREAAITREVDRYAHEEARKIVERQNAKKAEQKGREAFRKGIEAANKQTEERAKKLREDALLDELLDKFAEEDRVKAEKDAEARAKAAELQGIAEQIIEEEQNLDEIIADLDAEDAKQAAKVEAEKQKNDAEVAAILQEIEIEEKVRADIRAKQEAKAEAERNKAEKVAKLKELAAQQKALRERTEAMLNAAVESAAEFSDEMARREAAATELLTAETAKNKPAETALSDKTVKLLWTAPKDNNGWKKQYNYYYDALNDALRHVDSELFNTHLKNAEKPTTSVVGSKRVAGSATSWAIGAAAEDVRQGTISPMAAATLISRAYRQNGEEGLWDIVRIGDGNLTKEATEAAIAIDKEHNKPSATTNISPEAKKSLKTSPKKMNAGWHHYFPNGSAAFVAALNSISDGLFDKIKRKSLIYGRTVSQKGVLAAEGALQDLVRIIDNGYASPYKVATMLFDAMNGDADNAMEVLTDAKATAAIEREIYDDYYNAEVASKPAEEKPKPKKTAAVTEKQKQVIIKRLMKSAKKQSTDRMNLEGVMVREGKTYMLDGFRLFELNGDLSEGFPVLDEKTQTVTNGLIETLLNADTYDKEIPRVPSIDDVAAIAKLNKLVPVALGDNAPIVDAQKLLDMLQLLNPDTIRYTKQGKTLSGIYAETEAGRGVTLPMRVDPYAGAEYSVQADGSIVKGDTTRQSLRATDTEYLSLAEKYRDGTASAEDINVLNKAVEEAARVAGYIIKAYHGTNNDFTVFDKAKRGEQTDFNASSLELAATAHIGFWFNNNDVSGMTGQKRSIASYLNLNNPLEYDSLRDLAAAIRESYATDWDELDDDFYTDDRTVAASKAADAFVKKMLTEGHDGVVINDEEFGGVSYAVLDASQIKSADPVTYDDNGDIIPLSERFNADREGDEAWKNEDIRFSLRTAPAPKKTQDVYKLMRLGKDGKLYPLFIDSANGIEVGKWYDADSPDFSFMQKMPEGVFLVDTDTQEYTSLQEYQRKIGDKKSRKFPAKEWVDEATKNGQRWITIEPSEKAVKRYEGENRRYYNIGINGSGSVSTFAMRPGWHAGSLPTMRQIGKGSGKNLRDDSFVWVKGRVPADIDYQAEAERNIDKDIPTHIPKEGYYLKATNANAEASQADRVGWYVAGSFIADEIIGDIDARNAIDAWNDAHPADEPVEYDFERESGKVFNAKTMSLESSPRYQQRDFRIDFNVPQLDTKALHEAVKGGEGTVENRFEVKYEKTDSGFAVHITDKDSGKTYDRAETVTEGNTKAEAERAAAAVIRNIKRGEQRRTFREYADKREADARLAERMHEGAIRARIERKAGETEQAYKERIKKIYEDRYRSEIKKTALKWNKKLVDMLARPTENKHVPVQLARSVAEFCEEVTKYLDGTTKRGEKILDKIRKAYDRAFTDEQTIIRAKSEDAGYDARGAVLNTSQKDEQLAEMLKELSDITAEKSFAELTRDEMDALLNVVRGVAHTVTEANKMIGEAEGKTVWQTGSTMIEQLENAPKVSTKLRGYLATSLDLRRLARIFSGSNEDAEFVKLVEQLNQGAIEKERVAQELQAIFKPVTDEYGNEIKKWYGKKAEWLDTGIVTKDGVPVKITKGMRVSLALHVLNEGNMRHIERGGLTIPDAKLYAQGKLADAYANGKLVRLTAEQINGIIANMTEAEKAYVEAAKQLFHDRAGFYVNKTSLQLAGYTKANVENYFPIHTDKNFNKTDFASMSMDGSIEGQGFLKERVKASNPVYLEDITSVVNRQIRGVALYAGMAIPVRNFNAVMNAAVYEDEDGDWVPRTTVKQTLAKTMGAYGSKVVEGFVEDASEMSQRVDVTPVERIAGKLATNYVKAVLLGNAKVAMKQVASYPTAAAVIPWKYLAKGLASANKNMMFYAPLGFGKARKTYLEKIGREFPLFKVRQAGNANEIASIMNKPGMEQKLPALLGWITTMDVETVRNIGLAAEYMVQDQHPDYKIGSEAYKQAVAQIFNQTVQQTQPNFTPLQRSAALRSKNPIVRSLTLFGTQRMQNGGILIEAAMELKQSKGKSKEEIAAARAKLGRAVASQVTQNLLLLLATIAVDALRGRMKSWQDDDDELTLESVGKKMGDTFLSNILGSFLGGSEFYETISNMYKKANGQTTYDTEFSVPALDAIETIMSFGQSGIPNFINYLNGEHTDEEKLNKLKSFSTELAKVAGYATGLPLENAVKDVFKGFYPAYKDICDWRRTGELIPYLWQSGKLDNAKTRARYEDWIDSGHKGSEFFAIDKKLKGVTKRDDRADILWSDDSLAPEDKAMLMEMYDGSNGGYADGSKFFNKNDKELYDFAAEPKQESETPAEVPTGEVAEIPATAETPAATEAPAATTAPKSDKYTKAYDKWAQYGVTQTQAKSAVEKWDALKGSYEDSRAVSEYRTWLTKQNLTGRQRFAMFSQANADLEKKATEFNKKYGTKYEALWNAYTKYNGESFHGEEYRSWVEKQTSDYYQRFALVEFAEPRSNWIEHAEELHKAGVSYKAVWEAARYAKNQSGRGKKDRIIAYAKKLGMTSKQADNIYKWFG